MDTTLIADLFGVAAHQVALTYSTSDAINLALAAMRWQPGDEVVTTNLEHPGRKVELVTPSPRPDQGPAGLVSFRVEGYTPEQLQEECARAGLYLRTIPQPPCCRISTAFYVREADLEALADTLSRL